MAENKHRQADRTMQIKLEQINADAYDVREEVDEEHVQSIADSLDQDGQWNPIIVRPGDESGYDLIAGHTRYRAATRLGWDSLEATVKNIDDERANELALKTNLKRKGMDKLEEGRVVNDMMEKHNLSQSEVADKLDKSRRWVNDRIRVALDLSPTVKGLVQEGDLTYSMARVVTSIDEDRQLKFAELLIDQDVTSSNGARELKRRFQNDTIYTVGYQDRTFDDLLSILNENDIDLVLDVRQSTDSNYKPEFNGDILKQRLEENDIEYRHDERLGVHWPVRRAYKDGAIDDSCFADWYRWWLHDESGVSLPDLTKEIEQSGRTALLCIERHASPEGEQSHYCHRYILSEEMRDVEIDGRVLFPNKEHL